MHPWPALPLRSLIASLTLVAGSLTVQAAELVLTLRSPEGLQDQRQTYVNAAVKLALDKTLASHGPYKLQSAAPMNKQRALLSAGRKAYVNFVTIAGHSETRTAPELRPVRFPLMLGITGYRVCFVAPESQQKVEQVRSLDELRRQFSVVQGVGWADVPILRANGFHVIEAASYDALFRMVSKNRADLFCRSILEVLQEAQQHPELLLDRSFALAYDMPQFLYTHRDNQAVIERLTLGLQQAHADGSLQALMMNYLQPALRFVGLGKRRLHQLQSPQADDLGFDYRSFKLDPFVELR
ncbi:transporter substrate-binding domain-containing protein [Pelomonas sp. SE-A7]|uniref:transporter substrate-binding domain-containing protein n=1 Tax=Pelomonas sp. SE-A7 TaxID=3054953 RepID=UPI00259CAD6C|nr:transporter substrate-binding domain-containing protein [Pelomonas sp. SE-A7]MDM4768227.1 transporter substrate-binding domain-containing protein [Pelomonas sp. SE-A7]